MADDTQTPLLSTDNPLPWYSKDSRPEGAASSDKPASNLSSQTRLDLNPTPSGKRYMSFRVVWPSSGWERAVMCELGLTKKETVERLRLALPDDLSRKSVVRMDFQIPVGKNWSDVMDSDWDDLIVGQTFKEIRVEPVLTLREQWRPEFAVLSIIFAIMISVVGFGFIISYFANKSKR